MHDTLLQQLPGVWCADSPALVRASVPSGHTVLDAALGGGWPQPALLEFLIDQVGVGELSLLRALLKTRLDQENLDEIAHVLWLNPPYTLQAVALAQCGIDPARQWIAVGLTQRDTLWTMEQALRAGVRTIAWTRRPGLSGLRRLKLATAAGHCCGVLFRPVSEMSEASPANVRAVLSSHDANMQVRLLKVQGRLPATVMLDLQARAQMNLAERAKDASHTALPS